MGEVYRARDVQLDRHVAIKVLPEEVAADPERLRRFEQEARAASALNHPNIVTVYGVGESDSISYIAIELVEGKTLAEAMMNAPLPTKKVLDIGAQIAEGLAVAHEAGIVHRDLKPANVMVARDGLVKILDFGLAKKQRPLGQMESTATTELGPKTRPGDVMGTAGYMSPEQALGEEVDFRSDQFSLGSVLYELATGRRAFHGRTPIDTLAAVLNVEPEPIARIQPDVPAPLRWIVERCLAKEPAGRYQATRDLARELQGLKEHLSEISGMQPVAAPARVRRSLWRVAGPLAALAAGAALWSLFVGSGHGRPEPQFRRLTVQRGAVYRALFAPGSNAILYTAAWENEAPHTYLTLPDSYGADRALESASQLPLAFSQDGSQVLALEGTFRPTIAVRGALGWWPTLGGQSRRILDDAGWADWAPRGRFFAAVRDTGEERVLEMRNAEGQALRTVFRTAGAISFVRISPDEEHVAFIHHPTLFGSSGLVRVVSVGGSESKVLTPSFRDCFGLDWDKRSGKIWFTTAASDFANGALWSVGLSGPHQLLYVFPEKFVLHNVSPAGDRCLMVSSHDRATLTVRRAGSDPRDLSWFGWTMVEDVSSDGRSVLFFDEGRTERSSGSWLRPLAGGDATPLGVFDSGKFSPDGKWIVGVAASGDEPPQLTLLPVGTGKSRQLTATKAAHSTPSFVNAHALIFVRSEGSASEVWTMETDGSDSRSLGAAGCAAPAANPDGTAFLCLGGDRNGTILIYPMAKGPGRSLFALPAGHRFQYSRWNGSGDRIFAVTSDRQFLTLDASSGAVVREEILPVSAAGGANGLYTAAFNADATIQLYSTARFSSDLYLVSNIR